MSNIYILTTGDNTKNVYSNKKSIFSDMSSIKGFTLYIIKDGKRLCFNKNNVCRELNNSSNIFVLAIHNKSNIKMEYTIKTMCVDNEYFKKN